MAKKPSKSLVRKKPDASVEAAKTTDELFEQPRHLGGAGHALQIVEDKYDLLLLILQREEETPRSPQKPRTKKISERG